jgi:hypothetical protein
MSDLERAALRLYRRSRLWPAWLALAFVAGYVADLQAAGASEPISQRTVWSCIAALWAANAVSQASIFFSLKRHVPRDASAPSTSAPIP